MCTYTHWTILCQKKPGESFGCIRGNRTLDERAVTPAQAPRLPPIFLTKCLELTYKGRISTTPSNQKHIT